MIQKILVPMKRALPPLKAAPTPTATALRTVKINALNRPEKQSSAVALTATTTELQTPRTNVLMKKALPPRKVAPTGTATGLQTKTINVLIWQAFPRITDVPLLKRRR